MDHLDILKRSYVWSWCCCIVHIIFSVLKNPLLWFVFVCLCLVFLILRSLHFCSNYLFIMFFIMLLCSIFSPPCFYTVLISFLAYAILKLACSLFLFLLLFYFINLFQSIRLVVLIFPFLSMLKHIIWLSCLWDPFIFRYQRWGNQKTYHLPSQFCPNFLTVTMLKYFSLVYNEIHSMFTIISLAVFFPVIFWLDKTCYPVVSQRGITAQFPTFFHSFKWFDWNFCKTWRIAWLNINSWAQNSFFESIRYWFTCFGQ